MDLAVAGLALLLLSPILVVLAVVVRIRLGSPILFRQQRPGRNGIAFGILKFRTMTDARSADGVLLPDALRLTRLGRALRRSSLDELPGLVNVLFGHMSLVGPRPLLMEYLELYSSEQMRRHNVRPGLTGLAQVNGRNAVLWDERLRLDTWYVDNQSMVLDLRILAKTVVMVVIGRGVDHSGGVTMPRFVGPERRLTPRPDDTSLRGP